MTSCPHCGSVKVVLDHAKDGHAYLRDYGANHYYTCSARNGPKAKKKTRTKAPPVRRELESLGMSVAEAERFYSTHRGLSDDAMIMAALKEKEASDGSD